MDFPGFLQSWYADDFSMAGAGANILPAIARIEDLGPDHGFYLESGKITICVGPGGWGGCGTVGNCPTRLFPCIRGATSGRLCSSNRG